MKAIKLKLISDGKTPIVNVDFLKVSSLFGTKIISLTFIREVAKSPFTNGNWKCLNGNSIDIDETLNLFMLSNLELHDLTTNEVIKKNDESVELINWIRDNYSTNEKQGSKKPLPFNKWRLDFTDEIYDINEIIETWKTK